MIRPNSNFFWGAILVLLFGWQAGPLKAQEPTARFNHSAVWTGTEMIVWGGRNGGTVFNTGGRYNPLTRVWTPVNTNGAPSPREDHVAEWTGTEMIVWGGMFDPFTSFNDGARYNPATDTWTPMTSTGTPTGRAYHSSVWTGTHFIPWGGVSNNPTSGESYYNTGSRYSPASNSWAATSTTGAPIPREDHTAVWTGDRMIVWGGLALDAGSTEPLKTNTGGNYSPSNGAWTATTLTGAPVGRSLHTAVWTGSRMVVWGGVGLITSTDIFNSGGRYDPVANSWLSTSTGAGVPSVRQNHTAVWTGTEMIVWGGQGSIGNFRDTGGRYNPNTDIWAGTAVNAAARAFHTAVWTGTEMIVWGGYGFGGPLQGLGRYRPAENTWNTPPLCSLSTPANGAIFGAGASIALAATASDEEGVVSQVQFLSGTNVLSTDNSAPFDFNWNTAPAGVHVLRAVATDLGGLLTTSAPVSITVAAPPSVSISSPASGTVVPENSPITITATATPSLGVIAQVAFYNGAALLGTDTNAPFQFDWSAVPAGVQTITARVTDSLGGLATSAPVTITGDIRPTVAITSPLPPTRLVLGEPIPITANAGDIDGSVAQVEFRDNGVPIGIDDTAPFAFSWTNSVLGFHTLLGVATDNLGVTQTSAPVVIEVLLRPKLTSTWVSNYVRVQLEGETNRSYFIEYSSNLAQWLPFRTNIATNGAFTFEDPSVTNGTRARYYRATP